MAKKRRFKRNVVIADAHCGHRVGLTPPQYQSAIQGHKYHRIQVETWGLYTGIIDSLKPIDNLFVNADMVDGKGDRSGGSELITPDMRIQVDMAREVILYAEADAIVMTRGTPYHVSPGGEDWEDVLAREVEAKKIGDHEWIDVNGVVFDMKHKVGSSSIPHGRGTPIAKEKLWNMIWADHEDQPKSDIIIRSHVHYHYLVGEPPRWIGMTTPALQAMGSKFGARQCSGHVDWGLVHFDIKDNGEWEWKSHIIPVVSQKASALQL